MAAAYDTNVFAYRDDIRKDEVKNAESAAWVALHKTQKNESKQARSSEQARESKQESSRNDARCDDHPSVQEVHIGPDLVEIRLDGESMSNIVELFGEGEKVDSTTVRLPYWIARIIYKAWKGLPVPEFEPTMQTEPTRAAEILAEQSSASAFTYGQLPRTTAPPRLDDIMHEERKHEKAANRSVVLNGKFEANREQNSNNRIKRSDMPTPAIPRRKGETDVKQATAEKSVHNVTEEYANFLEETANQHEVDAKYQQSAARQSTGLTASYRHQEVREYRQKAKECRDQAYKIRVELSGDGIDLHGLTKETAVSVVKDIKVCQEQGRRKFRVITGQGKNNNGKSVIKQAVKRYLSNHSIRFEETPRNPGELAVFV